MSRPHSCPRGHRVAPESPCGSCPRCDAIQRAEDARIRRACAWCSPMHPTDGRGPILPGEPVSHGICPAAVAGFLGEPRDPSAGPADYSDGCPVCGARGDAECLPSCGLSSAAVQGAILSLPLAGDDADPDGDFLGGFGK